MLILAPITMEILISRGSACKITLSVCYRSGVMETRRILAENG